MLHRIVPICFVGNKDNRRQEIAQKCQKLYIKRRFIDGAWIFWLLSVSQKESWLIYDGQIMSDEYYSPLITGNL
jgi:hypothetical protein